MFSCDSCNNLWFQVTPHYTAPKRNVKTQPPEEASPMSKATCCQCQDVAALVLKHWDFWIACVLKPDMTLTSLVQGCFWCPMSSPLWLWCNSCIRRRKVEICIASFSLCVLCVSSVTFVRFAQTSVAEPLVEKKNNHSIFGFHNTSGPILKAGFKKVAGNLFYISDRGEAHAVSSCTPCDPHKTLCGRGKLDSRRAIKPDTMAVADFTSIPLGAPFDCSMAPEYFPDAMTSARVGAGLYTGFASYIGGAVYFVDGNQKFHSESCRPCGPSFTVCQDSRLPHSAHLQPILVLKNDMDKLENGGKFKCRMAPQYFKGYLLWHRRPLELEISSAEPVRLNVLVTGLGRDLTGGPLSIIRFLDQILRRTQLGVRWINVDGNGIGGKEMKEHLKKYPSTDEFRWRMEFVFDGIRDIDQPSLLTNPNDMFMSTLYFTALMAHATIQKYPNLRNRNQIYFIQDFEPIFFPHDANHLEALESYKYPHFAIYSTAFLEKWFVEKHYGQGEFIDSTAARKMYSYASEPAIKPWSLFNKTLFAEPTRTRKIIVYARSHADRNAYELTIDTLSAAVCEGFFDKETWEIIGVGATQDYIEHLGRSCGRHMHMTVKENIPENEYRKMVSSGDVGVSLMVSPHPSLPPFDFAAAGLVTLTNSFATKTQDMFTKVSQNFVVARPTLPDLLEGLAIAIEKAKNIDARAAGAKLSWESKWDGDACYGPTLMNLILSWFEHTKALW